MSEIRRYAHSRTDTQQTFKFDKHLIAHGADLAALPTKRLRRTLPERPRTRRVRKPDRAPADQADPPETVSVANWS